MSRQDSKQIENVKVMLLKGENGSSMVNIEKTGTQGLVDTYTITMDDGSKFTFNVSNGKEITSVEKTGTQGLVDTYTITFNDNSTETFTVTNGKGISSIEKTGTQGVVDTYTITFNDGTTSTFEVTNATGVIDSNFSETSTNPLQNKTVTSIIAGVENGSTASKTYSAGEYILRNNKMYEVTTAIASGGTITVGVNISETGIGAVLTQLKSDLSEGCVILGSHSGGSSPTTLFSDNVTNYHELILEAYITIKNQSDQEYTFTITCPLTVNSITGTNTGISRLVRNGYYFSSSDWIAIQFDINNIGFTFTTIMTSSFTLVSKIGYVYGKK